MGTSERSIKRSTAVGGVAIAIWSTMAVLSAQLGTIPPFELTAMTFSVATILSVGYCLFSGTPIRTMFAQPLEAWAIGLGGFFGFHFFYFVAFPHAPAFEASLITYLWPLLIVVLASLTAGGRLTGWHLAGALCGLAGTAWLVAPAGPSTLGSHALGDGAALVAALSWALYSVLSRRHPHLPNHAIGGYCAVTGLLAWLGHFAAEPTVWPQGAQWLCILAIGLGPVGGAFFVWDVGIKHGNLRLLGIWSYLTPLLSTTWLVLAGKAPASPHLVACCALIVGGAALGGLGDRGFQDVKEPAAAPEGAAAGSKRWRDRRD